MTELRRRPPDLARDGDTVDVCLVLEGTYPFVAGGVSAWTHHLVTHLPELRFGLLHISPSRDAYAGELAYEPPDNVVFLEEIYLTAPTVSRQSVAAPALVRSFWSFVRDLRDGGSNSFDRYVRVLKTQRKRGLGRDVFFTSAHCWDAMVATYRDEAAAESFLYFFWTWYFTHKPLLQVLTARIPRAHVYHTLSTGYAGILAAAARVMHGRPMILTEHGIYTKERRIEIHAATWIHETLPAGFAIEGSPPYFRAFWNRHFERMTRICYDRADRIFTLSAQNTRAEVQDGADPNKIEIVPNGVDVARFAMAGANAPERSGSRFTIAFVGRVCPIKDVRTFLSAVRLVVKVVPDVVARVLGPVQEDPEYAEQCQRFASELGILDRNVRFEGRVSIQQELPAVDLLVLTSISEVMPLVVLEAGALGIPVVTTDVGSCRDLIEGRTPEDRRLGSGGIVTPIASPGATARAILTLYVDPVLRRAMGRNLQERVHTFYDERKVVEAYRRVYQEHLGRGRED